MLSQHKIRINLVNNRHKDVETVSKRLDLILCEKEDDSEDSFNIKWMDCNGALSRLKRLKYFQCLNHFPGIVRISKRSRIGSQTKELRNEFPVEYDFFPDCIGFQNKLRMPPFTLSGTGSDFMWVCKRQLKSNYGVGVSLIEDKNLPGYFEYIPDRGILQRFIEKPMLIEGKKADIRCFCLITCLEPLMIYSYRQGFVRLCRSDYGPPNIEEFRSNDCQITCERLTENEKKEFFPNEEGIYDKGRKRCFGFLQKWLKSQSKNGAPNFDELMVQIDEIMLKTFLLGYEHMKGLYARLLEDDKEKGPFTCFEILGYDILLDEDFKPHYLDMNHSPIHNCRDGELSERVILPLIEESLKLLSLDCMFNIHNHEEFIKVLEGRLHAEMNSIHMTRIFPTEYNMRKFDKLLERVGVDRDSECYLDFFKLEERIILGDDFERRVFLREDIDNYYFSEVEKKNFWMEFKIGELILECPRIFLFF